MNIHSLASIFLKKTAQELDWFDKKREDYGVTGLARKFNETFSSTYQEEMQKLREIDTEIRTEATSLKPNLAAAKKALKDHRYLDLFHFADQINKALLEITGRTDELSSPSREHINEFYGGYENYDPSGDYSFAKEAGVLDSIFGTKRERAAKTLEKLYRKKIQKQKLAMDKLARNLEAVVNNTISEFKLMKVFRREGKLEEYIESLQKIEIARKKIAAELKSLYDTYIKDIIEYKRKLNEQKQEMPETQPAVQPKEGPVKDPDPQAFTNQSPALQSPVKPIQTTMPDTADSDEDIEDIDSDGDVDATDETLEEYEQLELDFNKANQIYKNYIKVASAYKAKGDLRKERMYKGKARLILKEARARLK
jgi:hypothetical protein